MTVALLGDIGLLGMYTLSNNPDLLDDLSEIANYLSRFDLVVGNLETPLSKEKKPRGAKSSYICTDTINIGVLKALHIHAVTLANNHMFDFGKEGYKTTVRSLDENGIKWFGVDGREFTMEFDDNRLVFCGFCCYSTNPFKISKTYGSEGINRFNLREASKIIEIKSRQGYLPIFAIHSGIEHVNTPSIDQIKASKKLADIAPFVWYGHHPHVIQGIERIGNSVIAHSLGNFCFAGNQEDKNRPIIELSESNRIGMILELTIEHNSVVRVTPTLVYIGEDGRISILNNREKVDEFSQQIKEAFLNPDEYNLRRNNQRMIYLKRRKEMRNLAWVLKRLRPRYARLLLDNKMNAWKYIANVRNLIVD